MVSLVHRVTRAVLRLVWPSILLLFIERWRHVADSNDANFINKNVFKFNWVTGSPPKFDTLLASCRVHTLKPK